MYAYVYTCVCCIYIYIYIPRYWLRRIENKISLTSQQLRKIVEYIDVLAR